MFNIFKKKRKNNMQSWEFELLKAVVKKLPLKYSFLNNQITPKFILDIVPNELLGHGWKRMIVDLELSKLYIKKEINYQLIGIKICNLLDQSYKVMALDLYDGILIGYRIEGEFKEVLFDLENINVEYLREVPYVNIDKDHLKKIMGNVDNDILSQLDIDITFKINVDEGEFYVIKDLGDGNYLSMDQKGAVYGMIHDPYEIEKLFEDKESFYQALKSGDFNMIKYYNIKML